MCGRYGGPKDLEVYAGYLPVKPPFRNLELRPEYGVGAMAPVFARNKNGEVAIQMMRMGLIPHFHRDGVRDWQATTHNARYETVGTLASFARSWERNWLCVVPAAWIGETLKVVDLPDGKLPAEFSRADGRPMGLAGLWDHAVTADGPILSFALITRRPGRKMSTVHPREVCVLEPERWAGYLSGGDVGLGMPWADDAWIMRLPERSKAKVAETPHDLFGPQAAQPD